MRPTASVFSPSFQSSMSGLMMSPPAQNLQMNTSWVNPNPALMDTVTINPSGSMSSRPNSSRQQQQNRASGYRLEPSACENPSLPQLSMRDLQCLDTGPQAAVLNPPESQPLFHQQHQRDILTSESQTQNPLTGQNQGIQNMWQGFNPTSTAQNNFNGSVPGGGRLVSHGHALFPLLEGMEADEFLVGGTSFQLKQEPQISTGPDSCFSQSPRENQGNTYTNLLPRPMSNEPSMDLRRHNAGGLTQPLANLQSPFSNNGMSSEAHFATVADWIKASQQND